MTDNLFQIQLLMESGGTVLWLILLASVIMWTLIIERYVYLFLLHPKEKQKLIEFHRKDIYEGYYQYLVRSMISQGSTLRRVGTKEES